MVQLSPPYMTTGKTIALTRQNFVGEVMSLLFIMLSRFVIAFLPKENLLNFLTTVTICSDFGAQENEVCHCFHCIPIYLSWSNGTGCHDLSFECWVLSQLFHSPLSLLSRGPLVPLLFMPVEWHHLHLRLLIFLLAILIPACVSSSLAFLMMYYSCKLNKLGDNIQLWCTPFPVWNQSIVPCSMSASNCCFLTCIQISQEAGQVVWYSHLFKNFPWFVVIHTVKGFSIVNKAETYFSGTLLLFRWSSRCWQFDLWFLCLF